LTVIVLNRTVERARSLAADFGPRVSADGYDALPQLLPRRTCWSTAPRSAWWENRRSRWTSHAQTERVVYDVVYVPLETNLLAAARTRGHRVVDGLGMLLQQAGFGSGSGSGPHHRSPRSCGR